MRPMPKPMNQATNMNETHLTLAKWRRTGIHCGIWRVVWANTLLCAEPNQAKSTRTISSPRISQDFRAS